MEFLIVFGLLTLFGGLSLSMRFLRYAIFIGLILGFLSLVGNLFVGLISLVFPFILIYLIYSLFKKDKISQ